MTHALATPTTASLLRGAVARLRHDPDTRSTLFGIFGVILVYLFLWLLGPVVLRLADKPMVLQSHSAPPAFNIEIMPEVTPPARKPPPPPAQKQFVETNPDAPENIPDHTNNFAAQNQQVAQEKPTTESHSDRPATEGKKDFESTSIVTGTLQKQVEHVASAPPTPDTPTPPTTTPPRAEQNPLPGFEKSVGDNANAFGSNISRDLNNARPIPERVDGLKDVPLIEGAFGPQPAIDPKHPRARASIVKQQQVRPAILAENKLGTSNIGPIGISAEFSNYGAYLQRLIEAVQLEWDGMVDEMKAYPPSGSFVDVKFKLNDQGKVTEITNIDSHTTDVGVQTCIAAIRNRSPYGEWTKDMKAVLGDQQELTFRFYYQ